MESQVSPKNIEARVEAMAAAEKEAAEVKPEVKAEEKPEVKAEVKPEIKADEKPEVKAEVKPEAKEKPEVKAEVKPEVKSEVKADKKKPNDPDELRKWSTKLSQENAQLRDDMKTIKAALDKLTKKPVDYAELAKNPDSLKAHIEAERQEAVNELQAQLAEKNNLAVKNETMYERTLRERDTENYPRWNKLFPLIQTLAKNGDGRINWNQAPGAALDEAYALAEQLSPVDAPAAVVKEEPKVEEKVVTGKTQAEIDAEVAAKVAEAEERGFKKAQEALRAEQAGGGIGSAGKGGRRDTAVSKEAYKTMPLDQLKAHIQKQSS